MAKTASQTKSEQQLAKELHAKSKIAYVPLDKLQVDLTYQRVKSQDMVDEIADDFNVISAGLILVSDRGTRPAGGKVDGGLFVVNGQHRYLAALQLGHDTIEARVIDLRKDPNPAQTEAMFRLQTNVGLSDRPQERFKAQIAAGDEESLDIVRILAQYDTEINFIPNGEFGINCVSTIEKLYRYDGGSLLEDTLGVMKDAYGEIRGQHAAASLFMGIAWFVEAHSTGTDRSRLISKLKGTQVVALNAKARTHASIMGKSLWFNVYRTIVELYNEKLTSKRLEVITRGANRLASSHGSAIK